MNLSTIGEALEKTFSGQQKEISSPSNSTNPQNIVKTLTPSDDDYEKSLSFSNLGEEIEISFGSDESSALRYQAKIIEMYRNLTKNPDVSYVIDMIVNEMSFNIDQEQFNIDIDEENNTIKEAISKAFDGILDKLDMKNNINTICRQLYVDGQLNLSLVYTASLKEGIKKIQILEPFGLYYDIDKSLWRISEVIANNGRCLYNYHQEETYDENYTKDELVHVDFGLFQKMSFSNDKIHKINLGYLENAFKAANQLNTLENMLVPLRYNRSVSRRLFNVDIADLPPKKAKQLMNEIRSEFKYKKSYNVETGTIKNNNATQPLVEDYWMSNRSGAKGTTVDTIDEAGSIMDLEDIIFSSKKLFTSLKVPSNRNPYVDDSGDFGYNDDTVTHEEMMFYLHVSKLRLPIVRMLKELLRLDIISKEIMSTEEWEKYHNKITISFASESIFLENMKRDVFMKGLENFQSIKEEIGTTISLQTAVAMTLNWSNVQLEEEMKKIQEEKNNILYKSFYEKEEF